MEDFWRCKSRLDFGCEVDAMGWGKEQGSTFEGAGCGSRAALDNHPLVEETTYQTQYINT
jgi:hypothetical protein